MVGWWVVQLSCEIKAISAPSWGLAGRLGLSLAKFKKKGGKMNKYDQTIS